MSHITYVGLKRYLLPAVKRVITIGRSSWIGEVDDTTVLKYPHDRGVETDRFHTEYKILTVLSQNPRIIGLNGYTDDGIYLERAVNGDMHEYLTRNLTISPQQRLTWCRQAAEAVAYAHSKRVIHCDIHFQGKHLSANGEVLLNGLSSKPCKFSCPRDPPDHSDIKTDLFALGSTIYLIMMGHDVFPDITDQDDSLEEEVQRRFLANQFPSDSHACSVTTGKCRKQAYSSAIEVVQDIEAVVEINKIENRAIGQLDDLCV
ncbi:hypothetical protein IFR05_002973 [Cadophora sp. M221]|nr:hypothetical protein IFR05_002973 [Cadophora sp. M221]